MYFASWNHCSSNRIWPYFLPLDFFLLCKFVYFVVMVESVTEIQHHTGKSYLHIFYSFEYIIIVSVTVKCMLHLLIYFSFPCDQSKLWTYKIDLKIHRVNIFHPYTCTMFFLSWHLILMFWMSSHLFFSERFTFQ